MAEKPDWLFEYFDEIYGSKIWPSTDSNDTPFNKFRCKLCGWQTSYQAFGSFKIGEEAIPFFAARAACENHLNNAHGIKDPANQLFPFKKDK